MACATPRARGSMPISRAPRRSACRAPRARRSGVRPRSRGSRGGAPARLPPPSGCPSAYEHMFACAPADASGRVGSRTWGRAAMMRTRLRESRERALEAMLQTRTHAWEEAGLSRQLGRQAARRARREALVLLPLLAAVLVAYAYRGQLFGR